MALCVGAASGRWTAGPQLRNLQNVLWYADGGVVVFGVIRKAPTPMLKEWLLSELIRRLRMLPALKP